MKKLKSILEQARELAKTKKQMSAIANMIADIDNSDVVESYDARVPQLVTSDAAEELKMSKFGSEIEDYANTMKIITCAAALWRERLGWSQGNGNSYVPLLSLDGERVVVSVCYTTNPLAMPTEEVAKAFGEKYKLELQKINNFLTK